MSNTKRKNIVDKGFEIQKNFWNQLQQTKFDINYYNGHFSRCVRIMRNMKYTVSGLTTLFTAVWMSWYNIKWFSTCCAIAIIGLQVFSAISERMPYEKRKLEIREMTNELDRIYIAMENTWRQIADGNLTKQQMSTLIEEYKNKQSEIKRHYFKDDFLPETKSVIDDATKRTAQYFKQMIKEYDE